ncbi:alkaline phosphatase family protein [Nocardia sp. NRRL S-836]|uniref:alkaline phosphatase family protein n=1 Tax=Nocardia sp. NRRL S-836 TaxID=1519492 RepID=UPI0018D195F4|nr:alkaline phosphatase family protein [Nocardia sp. NRRL S-836]
MKRRSLLKAAAGSVLLSAAPGVALGTTGVGRRVYVVVVDGLRPDEVGTALTPNLVALRANGTYFPRARSAPAVGTIPHHVMMMTGVRPDRGGVSADTIFDRARGVVRTLGRASDLTFPTVLERLPALGFRTGSVLPKENLRGVFGARASYRWEPGPPVEGNAPDAFTSHALHAMIDEADPDLVLVHFGDHDREGGLGRPLAVRTADEQLGKLVRHLEASGRWERSVLVVTADHPVDRSSPDGSLRGRLDADALLRNRVVIAENAGADLVSWTGPASDRDLALRHLESVVSRAPGVLSVHRPAELRLGPDAGDLVVLREAGRHLAAPAPVPLLVAGGDPVVGRGVSATPVSTVDVAPTVGRLFGLPEPPGGYDGQSVI